MTDGPTTKAGRALVTKMVIAGGHLYSDTRQMNTVIAQIETEAAAQALNRVADRVEAGEWDDTFTAPIERAIAEARRHALDEAVAAVDVERALRVFGFLTDRIEHHYGESPNTDYVLAARALLSVLAALRGLRDGDGGGAG